jgi:hypothetical protein
MGDNGLVCLACRLPPSEIVEVDQDVAHLMKTDQGDAPRGGVMPPVTTLTRREAIGHGADVA